MKKLLTLLMVGWAVCSFGALQYEIISTPGGNSSTTWPSGQKLTLQITEGGSLWLSAPVRSWWQNDTDISSQASMIAAGFANNAANVSSGSYGATNTLTGVSTAGTGESQVITYTNPQPIWDGTYRTFDNQAYYVGDFQTGEVLSFWVTTSSGLTYNSASELHEVDPNQAIVSRQYETDLAGNNLFRFTDNAEGKLEFILAGGEYKNTPSGQPLPGVIATLLLGGGALVLHRRRKNKAA